MSKPTRKKADPLIDPKKNYGRQTPGYKEEVKKRNLENQRKKQQEQRDFFKMYMG